MVQSAAVATEAAVAVAAAAEDCEKLGALSLALFVCRSGLCDGQSCSARVKGREVSRLGRQGKAQQRSGIRRWILAARVTQAGSPIANKASGTVMISEKAGYG